MHSLTSQTFRHMILTGANKLVTIEKELNAINVFPVADGDTGSNMAYLMRMIMRELSDGGERGLQVVKMACLRGSRGNSGMILSQFIITMCDYVQRYEHVSLSQFVEISEQAVKGAVAVVRQPIEGTILSVMKDWLSGLKAAIKKTSNIVHLLELSSAEALRSLERTKQQMPLLKEYNVVDAGAKGFCHFISGFAEGVKLFTGYERKQDSCSCNGSESSIVASELAAGKEYVSSATINGSAQQQNISSHAHENLTYRYCCEFMFEQCSDLEGMKQEMNSLGDSIIFVGDNEIGKLHIHSDAPHQVAGLLGSYSTVSFQKVEDMKRQQEMIYTPKSNIAIVVDSACDLPQELMDQYQIHMIPLTITVDQSFFLDKRTLLPETLYSYVQAGDKELRTSLPSREVIGQLYKQLLDHYDLVISIHVSDKLSGTYNACLQVANEMDASRILVFDSKTLSGAYGLFVLEMAKYLDEKLPQQNGDEMLLIMDELFKQASRHEILVTVPTLSSMVRSGRVSPMKGKIANLLNIQPLVTVDELGASKLLRPTMLTSSNLPKLIKQIERIHRSNPIQSYVVLYTDQDNEVPQLIKKMKEVTGQMPSYVTTVSSVIGIYAGTGAYSIAMTLKNTNERSYIS